MYLNTQDNTHFVLSVGPVVKHFILLGFAGLSLGYQHSLIVKQDGSVWSSHVSLHRAFQRFEKVVSSGGVAAAAGKGFSMVLKQDGTMWSTGRNFRGQLGDGSKIKKDNFVCIRGIAGAKAVAAGGYHSMVLTSAGYVWATGWNNHGQLGDGWTSYVTKFFLAISSGSGEKAVAISAGELHSMVLKQDGSVWAAGRNNHGQLGDGSRTDRKTFVKVISSGVVDVTAGGYHSMVLKEDGSVWATGWNEYGQLGDGTTLLRINYVEVVLDEAKAIAAGSRHSLVLKQDGSVWATGNNEYSQLGNYSRCKVDSFCRVISNGVHVIAAGAFHSMVVKEDKSIWATGWNKHGQLGKRLTEYETEFVKIDPFDIGEVIVTVVSTCIYLGDSLCVFRFLSLFLL